MSPPCLNVYVSTPPAPCLRYLYLTGKCDMRAVEGTIQRLIANGFNAGATKDPYRGFVYTRSARTNVSSGAY